MKGKLENYKTKFDCGSLDQMLAVTRQCACNWLVSLACPLTRMVHPVPVSYTCRYYIQLHTQAEHIIRKQSILKWSLFASAANTAWSLQAEGDLRQKAEALQKEKEMMAKVPVADNDILTLNVGEPLWSPRGLR